MRRQKVPVYGAHNRMIFSNPLYISMDKEYDAEGNEVSIIDKLCHAVNVEYRNKSFVLYVCGSKEEGYCNSVVVRDYLHKLNKYANSEDNVEFDKSLFEHYKMIKGLSMMLREPNFAIDLINSRLYALDIMYKDKELDWALGMAVLRGMFMTKELNSIIEMTDSNLSFNPTYDNIKVVNDIFTESICNMFIRV